MSISWMGTEQKLLSSLDNIVHSGVRYISPANGKIAKEKRENRDKYLGYKVYQDSKLLKYTQR